MENNELIQRLLQEDPHTEHAKNSVGTVDKPNKEEELPISRIRVVSAKYKVYIVLVLIFICILIFEAIPNIRGDYNGRQNSYQQAQSKLTVVKNNIVDAEKDVVLREEIVNNEGALKTCLNEKNSSVCASLPESRMQGDGDERKYDFSIPLSYLQLHSLYNEKMPIDEKKVLKNLNEYLIKQDITGTSRTKVGDILRIEIGDPQSVEKNDQHFFEAPVNVTIKFTTIGDLTGFLYNVEKKMIDNSEDRILYKIQTVSYDIVSNDEPQITDIGMLAYYYHDERFVDADEESTANTESEQTSQANNSEDNEVNENIEESNSPSESFFRKIFQS